MDCLLQGAGHRPFQKHSITGGRVGRVMAGSRSTRWSNGNCSPKRRVRSYFWNTAVSAMWKTQSSRRFRSAYKEFKANINTIGVLSISLVFITALGIAVTARYLIPGMTGWPPAFVLGAILSRYRRGGRHEYITKGLGISHKAITILEGESLINDASALVAYRFAVAAVAGTAFVLWKASLQFLLIMGGGILTGLVMGRILIFILKKVHHNAMVTINFMLLMPFCGLPGCRGSSCFRSNCRGHTRFKHFKVQQQSSFRAFKTAVPDYLGDHYFFAQRADLYPDRTAVPLYSQGHRKGAHAALYRVCVHGHRRGAAAPDGKGFFTKDQSSKGFFKEEKPKVSADAALWTLKIP